TVFNLYSSGSGVQSSYIAGIWYVLDPGENTRTLYGKAFGGAQKLVWWTGSNSVPLGGETKANAYVYISMNTVGGPRFGGTDVPAGGGGGDSALVGSVGSISNIAISGSSFTSLMSSAFAAMPTGGKLKITAT